MQNRVLEKISLPVQSLVEFQGDFKTLTASAFAKLKNSIQKNGFIQPFFVWFDAGQYFLLDGHQRKKAIIDLYGPETMVDCLQIFAKNERDAKKMVVYFSSQYGEFTKQSFFDFIGDLNFSDFEDFQCPQLSIIAEDFFDSNEKPEKKMPEIKDDEFVVFAICKNENEQSFLFEELKNRGFECKII